MFDPTSVRVRGPLQVHVEGFWAALMQQGYAPLSARNLLLVMAHLGRWLKSERLALDQLTDGVAASFLRHRRRVGYTQFFTERALRPLLLYLRSIGGVPAATPVIDTSVEGRFLGQYSDYLVRERGLSAAAIWVYVRFARRFVVEVCPGLDWRRLTTARVTAFVLQLSREGSYAGSGFGATYIRSLLRFLFVQGATPVDLSFCVPAVARWRLAGIPSALEPDEVTRLLAAFERTPVGLRDAAIVRILVRLGLRAGEASALQLDDVDWRAGELTVHGKGRHESRLPLPADVGRALAAYLRHGRPRVSLRSLFVRSRAPYVPMRPGAVVHVARAALTRVGIAGGAQLLRRTAATQLLRGGASLPEIAHVLRHRRIDTTVIYAKVDLASLRTLVQPWPGGAA